LASNWIACRALSDLVKSESTLAFLHCRIF
jgi:hypothetical protein